MQNTDASGKNAAGACAEVIATATSCKSTSYSQPLQHASSCVQHGKVIGLVVTNSQIADIANQLRKSVGEWILQSDVRTGKKWKQILRKNFVFLTQFTNKGGRQQHWQIDLGTAIEVTMQLVCPNWQTDSNHNKIYIEIQDKVNKMLQTKKSPRQDWLFQTAYFWLKSLNTGSQRFVWYPQQAIPVAHAVFASSGKFESFMNYMKRPARRPHIKQLIEACESIDSLPVGISYHVKRNADTSLPPPPPHITTAQYSTSKVLDHPSGSANASSMKH